MKKLILIILFIFFQNNAFSKNIVYLDVQYIIDNSEIGKSYKKKIKILQEENKSKLEAEERTIKKKETEIQNQKNILNKEEIDKKVKELNELIKKYQIKRNKLTKNTLKVKKEYTSEILNLLNPLLTNYVDKNKITLVIEKKIFWLELNL